MLATITFVQNFLFLNPKTIFSWENTPIDEDRTPGPRGITVKLNLKIK